MENLTVNPSLILNEIAELARGRGWSRVEIVAAFAVGLGSMAALNSATPDDLQRSLAAIHGMIGNAAAAERGQDATWN